MGGGEADPLNGPGLGIEMSGKNHNLLFFLSVY